MFSQIFHIGCMKTGTTTIQEILAEDDRINLILKSRYFNTNNYFFCKKPNYCVNGINVESDENIVRCYKGMYGLNESIYRIFNTFPEAKILITIREQRSLLISGYKHHIRKTSEDLSFNEFLNSSAGISYIKFLNYTNLYKSIRQYYKPDKIYILAYENLKNDFDLFFKELYTKVLELPPPHLSQVEFNKGDCDEAILFKRKLNKIMIFNKENILGKFENKIHRKIYKMYKNIINESDNYKQNISWPSGKLYSELENYFRNTNLEFQKITGIDIKNLNYLV